MNKSCGFWIRTPFVLANAQANTGAKAGERAAHREPQDLLVYVHLPQGFALRF